MLPRLSLHALVRGTRRQAAGLFVLGCLAALLVGCGSVRIGIETPLGGVSPTAALAPSASPTRTAPPASPTAAATATAQASPTPPASVTSTPEMAAPSPSPTFPAPTAQPATLAPAASATPTATTPPGAAPTATETTPAPTATATRATPSPTPICATAWFVEPRPPECPDGPAINSAAAFQRFQTGRMVWVEAFDTFFTLYAGSGQTGPGPASAAIGPLTLAPGGSVDNRVGSVPPGLFEPVSGFGLLWRGEVVGLPAQRPALGWAIEEEFGFETLYQCAQVDRPAWQCYLRDPFNQVLLIFNQPGLSPQWQEW